MPTARLTSKGRVTIPREIRAKLGVRPGDQIDFVIRDGGEVVVEAATIPLSQLRSCLKTARRCAVNLEMQNAIERGATGR